MKVDLDGVEHPKDILGIGHVGRLDDIPNLLGRCADGVASSLGDAMGHLDGAARDPVADFDHRQCFELMRLEGSSERMRKVLHLFLRAIHRREVENFAFMLATNADQIHQRKRGAYLRGGKGSKVLVKTLLGFREIDDHGRSH